MPIFYVNKKYIDRKVLKPRIIVRNVVDQLDSSAGTEYSRNNKSDQHKLSFVFFTGEVIKKAK